MMRTMLTAIAAVAMTAAVALAQQPRPAQAPAGAVPAPEAQQCQQFTATNDKGVVQHYEDCTPSDGLVKRCEVIDATDARGKVRKIQNCARVAPAGGGDAPK